MLLVEPLTLDVYLRKLVAKSSTLTERLNRVVLKSDRNLEDAKFQSLLDFWCNTIAKGDIAKFQRRLAADGLDAEKLRPFFSEVEYPQSQALPTWAQTLETILQTAQKFKVQNLSKFTTDNESSESPTPFEPFYHPFILVAQNQLSTRVNLGLLSENAQKHLWKSLLERMHQIGVNALLTEFLQFRSSGNKMRDFLLTQIRGKNSQEKYYAFLQNIFQDGLLSFLEKYPVLARLLSTTVEFWVESTAEFLHRLQTDWKIIEQQFSPEKPLQQVVGIKANLSDLHNRGRSALAIKFNTELKLVYKPKDVEMELVYNQIIQWCNNNNAPLPLKVFSVINQEKYGWVEFVEREDCADKDEAHRYYQRAGMILAVVHLLLGSDCHNENLIASGEQPVLIDLETLLTPRTKISDELNLETPQSALQLIQQQLEMSLLRTMLLPQKGILPNDSINIDLSGLGVEEYQGVLLTLRHINTDAMEFGYETVTIESNANAPKLEGVTLSPLDYLEDLVTGFEKMYRFFIKHQNALLQPDSPLIGLAKQTVRYIFRSTNIYSSILQKSYSPDLLQSGLQYSLGLEILGRAFLTSEVMSQRFAILNAERQAMEEGNIPFFTFDTSQPHLPLPTGEVVKNLFKKDSFTDLLQHVQKLSETDLVQQIAVIRGTFAARFVEEPIPRHCESNINPKSANSEAPQSATFDNSSVFDDVLVQQAVKIAEEIKQTAIFGMDSSVTWLGLGYRTTTEGFLFQDLGLNLYDGSCGVALFLAALGKITGDSQWSNLSRQTLQPLREILQENNHKNLAIFAKSCGIGGATGLGAIAYTLALSSQLLEDTTFLLKAQQVALLITPELIANDKHLDITRGIAGTILGLLAVYQANPKEKSILNLAIACGNHLLQQQVSIDSYKTWITWNGKALTGFSQGAAGIACALLNLWSVTQNEEFLAAARDAIAFERSFFSEAAGNWQDLRKSDLEYQISWSHGAAGIALGRIRSLAILDTPEIRQEIQVALETIQNHGIWGVDNLAWGNFGRIETLLVAAKKLNRPDLIEIAQNWSHQLIEKAQTQGNFSLMANIAGYLPNPAFLHGTSGIGYQLLRLAHPELPSVLSFDI